MNSVHYVVYASKQDESQVFGLLKPSWHLVEKEEGENDGLVSVSSQLWSDKLIGDGHEKPVRQVKFPLEADHLNELGWWDLDQLHGVHLWKLDLRRRISSFEDQVKAAYLKIALDAERLVS